MRFFNFLHSSATLKGALPQFRPGSGKVVQLIILIAIFAGLAAPLSAQTLLHRYSFTSDASDSVGRANGTLVGNAYITNGTLVLPGGGTSAKPQGYVSLPNGIVTNCPSITVECWLTDNGGLIWAEAWCFGDSAAGPGQPPNSGTSYVSLIPRSTANDFRGAFNLTGSDEADVIAPGGPMPINVAEYAVLTYDLPSTTARLYLNGVQMASATIPSNLSPANYGNTFNNWIGRDEFGGDPMFTGKIDELRIWNGAVSHGAHTKSTGRSHRELFAGFQCNAHRLRHELGQQQPQCSFG